MGVEMQAKKPHHITQHVVWHIQLRSEESRLVDFRAVSAFVFTVVRLLLYAQRANVNQKNLQIKPELCVRTEYICVRFSCSDF